MPGRSDAPVRRFRDRGRARRRARPHRGDDRAGIGGRAPRSARRAVRARDGGGGRLRRPSPHRRAASRCARRADGRRDRAAPRRFPRPWSGGPRCSAEISPILPAARSQPARTRSPRSAWRCSARSSRCSPRARPPLPRRWSRPGRASVEWKLDGARIQVHRAGDEVRAFTRNLNDVTARVPEVVEVVRAFAGPSVRARRRGNRSDRRRAPRRFQDTMSRFGTDDATSHAMTLAPFFFDVLHLDGEDLLDRTARRTGGDTRGARRRVARPGDRDRRSGRRRGVPRRRARHRSRRRDGQGARLSLRRRSTRRRVAQGQAGPHPRPRRARRRVGTRAPPRLALEPPSRRARSGDRRIRDGRQDVQGSHRSAAGLADGAAAGHRDRRDDYTVYVRPELVVEIALDGVQASTRYAGGVALRFARVRAYRPDKTAADADTIDAVRALLAP